MPISAIVGINWGDEGKGRMVDLLASVYDIVVRYQGGNNAGHTVVNEYGKFALNLIPSGIFNKNVFNILGNGCVIDIEHLASEIERLKERGVEISPSNLMVSERANICMPHHRLQDGLEEDRLEGGKYGSTRRGIAPVYGDKYLKKGIQIGELLLGREYLGERLGPIIEWKNLIIQGVYRHERISLDETLDWLCEYGERIKPYIGDAVGYLWDAYNDGRKILFEAQLGALRDIDFGIYPYTSSSNPLAQYAPVGSGLPFGVDDVLGVIKAFSTCVGEGPFVTEMSGQEAEKLREAGEEYGAATGRPRRVGAFDVVASKYGTRVQGATRLALTKLDILSYMDEIPVCTAYEIDGKITDKFPLTPHLYRAKPVYKIFKGWKTDISNITEYSKLPKEAREYIEFIEQALECPIEYISVGAERGRIIRRQV